MYIHSLTTYNNLTAVTLMQACCFIFLFSNCRVLPRKQSLIFRLSHLHTLQGHTVSTSNDLAVAVPRITRMCAQTVAFWRSFRPTDVHFKSMMSSISKPAMWFPFIFAGNLNVSFEQKQRGGGTKRIPLFPQYTAIQAHGKYANPLMSLMKISENKQMKMMAMERGGRGGKSDRWEMSI